MIKNPLKPSLKEQPAENLRRDYGIIDPKEIKDLEDQLVMDSINMKDMENLIAKGEIDPNETYGFGLWIHPIKNHKDTLILQILVRKYGFSNIYDLMEESSKKNWLEKHIYDEDGLLGTIDFALRKKKTIVVFIPDGIFSFNLYTNTDDLGFTAREVFRILKMSNNINGNVYFVRGAYD